VRLLNEAFLLILSVSLFHGHDFATFIAAAFWTDTMLQARLLTIGTDHRLWNAQRIVRPALAATRF